MMLLTAVQDHSFNFTGADFAWILALLLAVGNVFNMIVNWIRGAKTKITEPDKARDERINQLSIRVTKLQDAITKLYEKDLKDIQQRYEDLINHYAKTRDRHDKEISELNEGQLILVRALRNELEHQRRGDAAVLDESINELDNFLYRKANYKVQPTVDEQI